MRHIIKITIDANFDDIADGVIDAINSNNMVALGAILKDVAADQNVTLKAEYHDPVFDQAERDEQATLDAWDKIFST